MGWEMRGKGSRKVAQRNFELEGRDFRRWIGIADIKQTTCKTLMTGLSLMIYLPIIQLSGDISKAFGGCCGIPGLQSASLQDTLH